MSESTDDGNRSGNTAGIRGNPSSGESGAVGHEGMDQSNVVSLPTIGRLAGIDYGTVRVGVAISDASQTIASPLEVYTRRSEPLDRQFFLELTEREQIVGFVVGLPVHMSGDPSEKSREAIEFGKWLQWTASIPVTWFDERFSTAMAREILNQSNMSGKKRKSFLDKMAAQILLSAYFESMTRGSDPADRIDD